MRVVAYLRVSTESQVDGYGLDVQERDVRRWCRANGHRLVAVYREAKSGTLDPMDRPELSAAIAALRAPRIAEGIVLPLLDRLARAVTIQEAALALAWREGGSVFTVDRGEILRDDPDDPMRTAMREMMGVFAGLERRIIVKRMRDGRRAKAASGRKAVGAYAYGQRGEGKGRTRDAAPDPRERETVAVILGLRGDGWSYRRIAAELDRRGLRPRRAEAWSPMSVRSVVQRYG